MKNDTDSYTSGLALIRDETTLFRENLISRQLATMENCCMTYEKRPTNVQSASVLDNSVKRDTITRLDSD